MYNKKTIIQKSNLIVFNEYDFPERPSFSGFLLKWDLIILENSGSVSLQVSIPSQKIEASGTLYSGEKDGIDFTLLLPDEVQTVADSESKLFPSDIFPKEVEMSIKSIKAISEYSYEIQLSEMKVIF